MIYIFIIIAIVLIETNIKNYIVEKKDFGIKEGLFHNRIFIRKHYNRGMALNFLEDKKEIVKTISKVLLGLLLLLFVITLPKKGNKLMKLGLSFAIGGGLSNVLDRVNRGYVVDYFSINVKKLETVIFNIADFFIFIGAFFMGVASLFSYKVKCGSDKATE